MTDLPHDPRYKLFGVRHHGPGTARALRDALDAWRPDLVLVEGPADANDLIPWLDHELMEPPVALLVYHPDHPNKSAILPFVEFSPEYQALRHALDNRIPARFFDLPHAVRYAADVRPAMPPKALFEQVSAAAGMVDYELWWNGLIEQRQNHTDLFEGVLEMMMALREPTDSGDQVIAFESDDPKRLRLAEQREAYMRRCLRQALDQGFERIAVVAGAFHLPGLLELRTKREDDALLANMPSIEMEGAWVPWTYGRMAAGSGYGAGLRSPGWYQHLWESHSSDSETDLAIGWLSKIATLMREAGLDASAAHVIEAVRLAEALAAMRGLPRPTLDELNDAALTVICNGHAEPMQLIERKLVVGERMGSVPPDVPLVPLQRDLRNAQRRLDLRPKPEVSTLELDLREARDLERSQLLHRLNLLGIPWGREHTKQLLKRQQAQQGTFREAWRLTWQPDFAVRVIEMNIWGNTVQDAATGFAVDTANKAPTLAKLTELLDKLILCDLPDAVRQLMTRIDETAALSSDVLVMIDALPPLVRILRYGSVRQLDKSLVQHVVEGLITRICINLPSTIANLDDDAATEMIGKINGMHGVINTLNQEKQRAQWLAVLETIADQANVHKLLVGRAVRLLFDGRVFSAETTALHMQRSLTTTNLRTLEQLQQAAFWVEGFLKDSGLVVIHDERLWALLDRWIVRLGGDEFKGVLPLLRRTFSSFGDAAREQMQNKVRGSRDGGDGVVISAEFDPKRAEQMIPFALEILGLQNE